MPRIFDWPLYRPVSRALDQQPRTFRVPAQHVLAGGERQRSRLNHQPGQSVLLTLVGSPSWVVKRDAAGTRRIRLSAQELPGSARKNPESDRAAVLGYIIVDRTSDCSQVSG